MSAVDLGSDSALALPVTIVTGFLGSGKTTLLAEIVRSSTSKRIAVIQNEVSEEMGIESAVLTDSNGNVIPDFFELPNGCICCSAKNDMILALENIVNLGKERIDAVVVETTGIADPCSVAEIFWVDSALGSSVRLDGIVTVVDCVNFLSVLEEGHMLEHGEVGRRQVAIGDRILLNKTDLASSEQISLTRNLISELNPTAEIIETCRSKVDPSWVLEIGSFTVDRNMSQLMSFESFNHTSVATAVDHVFLKFASQALEKHRVEQLLGEILWESGLKIYRMKGIFGSSVDDGVYLVQSVGALFEVNLLPAAHREILKESKFLFIGRHLNEPILREYFQNILVPG